MPAGTGPLLGWGGCVAIPSNAHRCPGCRHGRTGRTTPWRSPVPHRLLHPEGEGTGSRPVYPGKGLRGKASEREPWAPAKISQYRRSRCWWSGRVRQHADGSAKNRSAESHTSLRRFAGLVRPLQWVKSVSLSLTSMRTAHWESSGSLPQRTASTPVAVSLASGRSPCSSPRMRPGGAHSNRTSSMAGSAPMILAHPARQLFPFPVPEGEEEVEDEDLRTPEMGGVRV